MLNLQNYQASKRVLTPCRSVPLRLRRILSVDLQISDR